MINPSPLKRSTTLRLERGDTLVEVLLAIAIVAFAIGSAYVIASKSLQQGINARERTEAVSVLENQINALKFRAQKTNLTTFNGTFTATTVNNFCLSETSTNPAAADWAPIRNKAGINVSSPLTYGAPSDNYHSNCVKNNKYFIDITTHNHPTPGLVNPTIYTINVRWERVGGGPINESKMHYRF